MAHDEEPDRGPHDECLHEITRLRDALEAEAIDKARVDRYALEVLSAGDVVGREVDVGGIKFRIGCDERANLCAIELDGTMARRR